ncbi:TPR-like protein [Boletus reticuloceps]|uniref:TPR-like protein n=1 Tax=Boletus reticuloceps TaxID=495285 RepID=A0A8I2YJ34_9AGAM|nr:TPR-like protein [Boletus reticuloceps]
MCKWVWNSTLHHRSGAGEDHGSSTSAWTRFGLLWKRVWTSLRSGPGSGAEQSQHESSTSPPYTTQIEGLQTPDVSNPDAQCKGQEQEEEEEPGPENQPQDGPPFSASAQEQGEEKRPGHGDQLQDGLSVPGSAQEQDKETPGPADEPQDRPSDSTPAVENKQFIITSIRATDVALGLRRLPVGFYTAVHHSGLEWRTENKRSFVNNDVVQWDGPIQMPLESSATVRLEVYATFEFQPILGTGELLRKISLTVEQLLDRSARQDPFTFFPRDRDVVSPCSSVLVTVEQWKDRSSDSSAWRVLGHDRSAGGLPSELEDATNQGHSALSRHRKYGGKPNLERSINQFDRALGICPLDHGCLAAAQANLAMAKLILSEVEGTDVSLEVPLNLYRNALAARPVGHLDRPSNLIQLAAVHHARFRQQRDEIERTRAEGLLREAMELSSTESHQHRSASFMLQLHAGLRMNPVQVDGELSAEQASASRFTEEDPWELSVQLLKRFERFGYLPDIQRAIAILEELVRTTSLWDHWYCTGLANLGIALSYRFNHLGDLDDLENVISILKDAVDLTPQGHPDKPSHLNNLATSFVTRFQRLGELSDLEKAISALKDAVDLIPHGHPHKPGCLDNLGTSFKARFEHLGELSDLENAISILKDAVDLTPQGHPDKPSCLNSLATSFVTRFERLGELSDLKNAISILKDAVDLTPQGHPDKPSHLNNLATSFVARFERLGELSDLENAISILKDAVDLTPQGHPDKPSRVHNLATSFKARFERLGELSDLENAISILKDAVDLTPHGHPDKPACLDNLGTSFVTRFEHLGELSDLENAISILKDAVDLTPQGHSHKLSRLSNLATSFVTRFWRLGELSDLENAISALKDAVDLTPHGHPHKPGYLHNLGTSFKARFERLGELSDLEKAISVLKDAVDLIPHGHPHKPACLDNLGTSFKARFEHLGELSDLENANSILKDAVDLTPHGHPDKPSRLDNFGTSLKARFEHLGELSDLENAISILKDAVDLTPHGHPHKPRCLHSLGTSFKTRFKRLGELSDLEKAISALNDAVDLTPHGHPHKPACLDNLGTSFKARFERLGELSDLENAISILKDAVDLTPQGHPDKPSSLNNLATSFKARFEGLGELRDLHHAITLYSHAASVPTGPASVRFRASQNWISCARRISHRSVLHAYSAAITLLPQLAWTGLSFRRRFSELRQGANVVREAAAAALDFGLPETAVEWLEQGRSIVWGELLQLRSTHEELSSAYPDHACRLRELSAALEDAGATHERSSSALLEHAQRGIREMLTVHTGGADEESWFTFAKQGLSAMHRVEETWQQGADRLRTLAIERDDLLHEIRRFAGFERFLLQKEFSQLRTSAHAGPVVILNAAESRCDALIVLAHVDHVIHVPLPNITLHRCADLQHTLKSLVRRVRAIRVGERVPLDDVGWEPFLSPLWKCVVKPVLDALAFSSPGDLSRIFWCPTGPFTFLPIHAAGFYDPAYLQVGHKVYDFVVSSYVPSLSILALSRKPITPPSDILGLLAVRQPPSDGQSPLPGVHKEVERIKDIIKNLPSARTSLLESSAGTVEEVLSLMKETDWVHFACHGIQDAKDPTASGLCLADGRRLKVSDIIALSRPHGGLAFLSACQTATGDKDLSDEAIHIAAGMLFAGYGGVVGTMWSISDEIAPDVARDVYQQLFGNGTRPDYREAALALHEAVGCLREDENVTFDEWIPFIHVGL